MHLNVNLLNAQFYTDHLLAKTKSLEVNMGAWVVTAGKFTVAYLYIKRSELGDTVRQFADNV